MATPSLSEQLAIARDAAALSGRKLAKLAKCDPATISALERGSGTLASLRLVASALSLQPSPYHSALVSKRRWLGIGTRKLSSLAGISRPAVQSLEQTGAARVTTFEAVAAALDEAPRLVKIEPVWSTPRAIIDCVLAGLGITQFDLDPASDYNVTSVPCRRRLTERDGGLWHKWESDFLWLNPPYASEELPLWVEKMLSEHRSGRAKRIVALIPFAPNTSAWWRASESGATIFVLKDRLRFGERTFTARLPSAVCALGLNDGELARLARELPAHQRVVTAQSSMADALAARHG